MKVTDHTPITLTTTSYPGWPELEFALCRSEEDLEGIFMDLNNEGIPNFELLHGRSNNNIIIDPQRYEEVLQWLNDMHLFNHYSMPFVCDGTGWELKFPFHRGGMRKIYGHMYFPPEYDQLLEMAVGHHNREEDDEDEEEWDDRSKGPWFLELERDLAKYALFTMHRRKGNYDYLLSVGHYELAYFNPTGIATKKGSYGHARAEIVKALNELPLQPPTEVDCTYIRMKSYPKYMEYLFGSGTDVSGLEKVFSKFLPPSCVSQILN